MKRRTLKNKLARFLRSKRATKEPELNLYFKMNMSCETMAECKTVAKKLQLPTTKVYEYMVKRRKNAKKLVYKYFKKANSFLRQFRLEMEYKMVNYKMFNQQHKEACGTIDYNEIHKKEC